MTNIEKWQLARNILDAKKAIDSLWFISLHGQELYNVRDLCYGKRSDYYINVCALLDKSICPKKEKKNITNTDSVIKRIYTERDKHYAHKDTSYITSFPYSSLKAEAFSLQNELRHIRNRCSDYLPDVFTLDYVCYDGQLFRQIEKINPVDEAKIKEQKYPLQNNSGYSENGNDTRRILYDIDDLNGMSEEEKRQFCVVIEDELGDNSEIEEAIALYYEDGCRDNFVGVLEAIRKAMHQKNCMIIPMVLKNPECICIDQEHAKVGDTFTNEEPMRFALHHIQTEDGKRWLVAFTSREEYEKGKGASTMAEGIKPMLRRCGVMPEEGFIINPWGGKAFLLTKELMQLILDVNKPENGIYFEVGDITKLDVEVIVNAANKSLLGGGGVDGAIHRAAGPGLLEECRTLGGCEVGEAKITGGYDLKAEFVIHTVGPRYRKDDPECPRLLAACYTNSLELAKKYNLHVIAFPAISTGVYGYPPQEAARVALRAVEKWLTANPDYGMAVVMSCYDQKMRQCYQKVIDAYAPGKE